MAHVAPAATVALIAATTALATPAFPAVVAVAPATLPDADVIPGNGLVNTIEAAAAIIGPALGGLLLVLMAPAGVLLVDAALFVVGAGVLWTAARDGRAEVSVERIAHEPFLRALAVGMRTITTTPGVAVPLLLVLVVNVVLGGASIGLLLVADELLDAGDAGFGVLHAALGTGFVGIVVTNRLASMARPLVAIAIATLVGGVPFAFLATTNALWIAALLVAIASIGCAVTEIVALTVILRTLPRHVVARVFGITDSLLVGSYLAGSLLAPLLVAAVGLRGSLVVVGGVLPLVAVIAGIRWHRLDRVYV
ncbi:MAG: MFS transporter [Ilumatobacteraceae bacterium]